MAECPNCNIILQWDYCNDTFRTKDKGEWAEETQIVGVREVMPEKVFPVVIDDIEVFMQQCPGCKKILGFSVLQDGVIGGDQFNCTEWDNIDWDSEPHSYSDC